MVTDGHPIEDLQPGVTGRQRSSLPVGVSCFLFLDVSDYTKVLAKKHRKLHRKKNITLESEKQTPTRKEQQNIYNFHQFFGFHVSCRGL